MMYLVQGKVTRGESRSFTVEVDAKSEKHAKALVLIKIGSREGTEKSQIEIVKIEIKK